MPQPVPVPVPVPMVQKSDMTTQTDSDFEEFLQIPEDEFEEYKNVQRNEIAPTVSG